MAQLRAALFDFDGTLVDTEGQYSIFWGKTARTYRPDIPGLENIIKGTTLTQIFSRYFPDPQLQQTIQKGLDAWEAQMDYPWVAGAEAFLRDLKAHGVRVAVVTSSNLTKMAVVNRKFAGFTELIDRVLTSEDFAASKPDPDCYLKGAAAMGCQLDECIVFEDAFTGLQAGMSSGIYTVGLTTGNPRSAIEDKCHRVIDNFEGLTYETAARWIADAQ